MLTLAAMTWAAYAFIQANTHMYGKVPNPVIIERGSTYNYSLIESAIYVPANWQDDCYSQQLMVLYMAEHFNAFRNGQQKLTEAKLDKMAEEWVCIK